MRQTHEAPERGRGETLIWTRLPPLEGLRRPSSLQGGLPHPHRHTQSQTHTDTDTDTHRHTQTHTHRHRQTQTHRHRHTHTHTHGDEGIWMSPRFAFYKYVIFGKLFSFCFPLYKRGLIILCFKHVVKIQGDDIKKYF